MHRPAILIAILALTACAPDPALLPAEPAEPANIIVPSPAIVAAPPPAAPNATASLALAVDGEGLRLFNPVNGAARPLPFGTARALVLTALAGRGAPDLGTQTDCGAGPLDFATWRDELKLYFQAGKFTGWAIDDRAARAVTAPRTLTTAAGIALGSSRAELDAAYAIEVVQSTLGTEFTAGGLAGLLDGPGPRAKITNLWAGTSCNFR